MNTHEFQAKEILTRFGVPIPLFYVAENMEDVQRIIEEENYESAVLKIQVHAGGRGKAGGVKLAKSREEILQYAEQMIGMKVVNNQTGPQGVIAHKLLISPITDYKKEYYLGAVIDRRNACAVLIASPEGGVEIEEVAAQTPERILKLPIGLDGSLKNFQLLQLDNFMGWKDETAKAGNEIAKGVAKAFVAYDALLLEINPLVKTEDGQLIALDAKLSIDENALFRQSEIASFYDPTQLPDREVLANKYDLAYIALDGNIGCMVNGAGLAMATMDIILYYGGKPANFLDVGGGASQEKVAEGFKIILSDPQVKAVLVNIFGGIMNCVTLAAGIIAATSILDVSVPLIIRMEGTNVDVGKKMLEDSGLNFIIAETLSEAAEKAVNAAKGGS